MMPVPKTVIQEGYVEGTERTGASQPIEHLRTAITVFGTHRAHTVKAAVWKGSVSAASGRACICARVSGSAVKVIV